MTGNKTAVTLSREDLKRIHQKQIFLLARGGHLPCADFIGISRAELTAQLGLSFPSVSALVDELLEKGILEETGELESSDRGRPRKLLRVSPSLFHVPVFELKSDGFHFCLYDAYGGIVRKEFYPFSRPNYDTCTLWEPDVAEFCAPFLKSISELGDSYRLLDILLSLPGNIKENGAFTSSYLGIVSPPDFLQYIEQKTTLNVHTINRSDSFAYAEQLYDPSLSDYVYVHISDGVGAGIIREGQIFTCEPWRAGEIGHLSIDYNGRPCRCGSRGCLERYLSKDALVEDCRLLLADPLLDFDSLCCSYVNGQPQLESFIDERAELLCTALNNMFAMHPVTHVIIGGSITLLGDKFLNCLKEKMEKQISRMYKGKTALTFSKRLGNDSTFGCYHNYVTNQLKIESLF